MRVHEVVVEVDRQILSPFPIRQADLLGSVKIKNFLFQQSQPFNRRRELVSGATFVIAHLLIGQHLILSNVEGDLRESGDEGTHENLCDLHD